MNFGQTVYTWSFGVECRILAVSKRIESAFSLGRFLMEVSTPLIISSVGIFLAAVAKVYSLIRKGDKMTN